MSLDLFVLLWVVMLAIADTLDSGCPNARVERHDDQVATYFSGFGELVKLMADWHMSK